LGVAKDGKGFKKSERGKRSRDRHFRKFPRRKAPLEGGGRGAEKSEPGKMEADEKAEAAPAEAASAMTSWHAF
jgi:hypothetical protein